MAGLRKDLSLPGLLSLVADQFQQIPDIMGRQTRITLKDCLLSGLAIFNLKYPSLLQFDAAREEPLTQANLKTLFGIEQIPSDT
ncbi:MAG: hypothetical protein QF414_06735 [Arenicellales bacterium]|jgi:hypothetical protein|nr:hypothetical protein [Arenicellales bacterium]|tara:strand:- start:921 stop:1172 length:252 start_codon:yes stop_codon:yes gene_type:complete